MLFRKLVVPTRLLLFTGIASFLFSLSISPAHAQSAFEPGYIVTASGDTTQGFVENMEWQRAPKEIRFSERREGTPQTLGVTDIAGFGVGTYVFERHILEVDRRPVELNKTFPSGNITQRDTLFLQRLVEGPMTLYSSYTNRPHFFVETYDRELTELIFFLRPVEQEGTRRIQRGTHYRQQLSARRTEVCPEASVSRLDFSRKDLTEFAASCNPNSDGSILSTASYTLRLDHVFSLRGSRTASYSANGSQSAALTGFSPGLQYQLLVEMGERNPAGAFLFGIGIQRMRGSLTPETVRQRLTATRVVRGTTFGDLTATVVDIGVEMRVRMGKADWRPFFGAEAALLFPLSYQANTGVKTEPVPTQNGDPQPIEINTGAKDWNTMQVGVGGGIGIEGPKMGGRLGLLYGFPLRRRPDAVAPPLVGLELQLFVKL